MSTAKRVSLTVYVLLSMALLAAILSLQGALLDSFSEAWGLEGSSKGLANTSAFIGSIAALITAFFLQGRVKKYALLRAALVVCALSLCVLWAAPGYALFTAGWFVLGVGIGWIDALLSAMMADLYTGKAARIMMCMLHMTFGLSSTLSPMLYQALLRRGVMWQRIYLPAAAAAALLVIIAFVGRALGVKSDEALVPSQFSLGRLWDDIRSHDLLPMVGAMAFHGLFLSGLNTWINRFAEGFAGGEAMPAMSCLFLGVMLSRLIVPFLPIDTGRYCKAAGFLGCAALLCGLWGGSGVLLRACVIVSGLLFGALIPCILNLGCSGMAENTLLASTTMMFALYLGQSLSSPLIGFLESAISLRAGIILCAACMPLCSLCCAWYARAKRGKA